MSFDNSTYLTPNASINESSYFTDNNSIENNIFIEQNSDILRLALRDSTNNYQIHTILQEERNSLYSKPIELNNDIENKENYYQSIVWKKNNLPKIEELDGNHEINKQNQQL